MTWDFAEASPFSESGGGLESAMKWVVPAVNSLVAGVQGSATQADARVASVGDRIVSSDPPYFDNILYADLSDFFYVWLRHSLASFWPEVFATLATPKDEELVAAHHRHGGKAQAERYFLDGMSVVLTNIAHQSHRAFPVTAYYAFKQAESEDATGTASTGWETFLEACLLAGFSVVGTWPMRTELSNRLIGNDANALASSIVLVFRPRLLSAQSVARREFMRDLEHSLGAALAEMTEDPAASIAPVDLAQAAIGPGMAIFSKYKAVLEADGSPMSVHSALIHINKAIDDYFAQAEGDMDADTRFCIGWFQQYEYEVGPFGQADVLARAKGTSVEGVRDAGVIHAAKGEVRLLRVKEYPAAWDPTKDSRLPIWEACHQMCRALGESESEAGALLARMPEKQDAIRQLAYRLYTICERKGWAEDARAYNELVTSWPAIVEQSLKAGHKGSQMSLL
jgi:putative DNA methylase